MIRTPKRRVDVVASGDEFPTRRGRLSSTIGPASGSPRCLPCGTAASRRSGSSRSVSRSATARSSQRRFGDGTSCVVPPSVFPSSVSVNALFIPSS